MATSRKPGPQGMEPFNGICPACTPGPLGINDQADPNVIAAWGDTPGPLGVNDWADPAFHRTMPRSSTAKPIVGIKTAYASAPTPRVLGALDTSDSATIDQWVELKDSNRLIGIAGGYQGSVVIVIPLFDPRDADYSGSIGVGERFGNWFSGGSVSKMRAGALLRLAALEFTDPVAEQYAIHQILNGAFELVKKGIGRVYIDPLIGGGVGKLAGQALNPVYGFFIKKGAEYVAKKVFLK